MYKVLVVDDQKYARDTISEFVRTINEVEKVDSACDGDQAIEFIKSGNYNLLILDLVMQNKDGLEVLKFIDSFGYKAKVVVVSAVGSSKIVSKVSKYNIDYYFKKSFNFDHFKSIISNILLEDKVLQFSKYKIVEKIGIPSNLLGFKYINNVIKIMINDDKLGMGQIYEIVAERYNTSPENVETNIRNAISHAHKSFNIAYQNIFDISPGDSKPKNSVFLFTLLRYITENVEMI